MAAQNTDRRIWEQFLDSAKCGTRTGGTRTFKSRMCRVALKLSDMLIENGTIYGDRYPIWSDYLEKVCSAIEVDDALQRTVREYFLCKHSGDLSDFSIEFEDKFEGTSIGSICDVKFSGTECRFFIKIQQSSPRPSSSSIVSGYSSSYNPFIQEIYVYQLLSLLNVGGEVHFPLPISPASRKTLYIVTKEVKFVVAEQLTSKTANPRAMVLVDFLQYVLRLQDIGSNGGNYGQTDEGEPVIVDFWVTPMNEFVLNDDQLYKYWNEYQHCNSRLIAKVLKNLTIEQRKEIIHQSIEKWNLVEKMDEAKLLVEDFLKKNEGNLDISGDLNRYVSDIKTNVDKLIK